jgi:hypothetical protein
MKLRCLAALLGLALAAGAAHAQVAFYIAPTYARITTSTPDTGPFAFLGENNTSANFKGADLGVYYDFPSSGSLKIGADVRDRIIGSSAGARDNSFLVGVRVVYSAPARLHPYAEALVGLAGTHSGKNPLSLKRAEFGALAGADYVLGKHADFRVLELGFTSFEPVSSSSFGTGRNASNVKLISIASGLVVRF